jgi:hypothetical protein
MRNSLARLVEALASARRGPSVLDGFVDGVLQKFENCRAWLDDAALVRRDGDSFFRPLYEAERDRLKDAIRLEQQHLGETGRDAMFAQVDELLRSVAIPAYERIAVRFTVRERNGFYLLREPLHGVERVGWAMAGIAVGVFVVWAPFIPLWSKEWVLPFFLAGLVFPELRRWWEIRRYERELNRLVARTDAEIGRLDLSFLLREGAKETALAVREQPGAVPHPRAVPAKDEAQR